MYTESSGADVGLSENHLISRHLMDMYQNICTYSRDVVLNIYFVFLLCSCMKSNKHYNNFLDRKNI